MAEEEGERALPNLQSLEIKINEWFTLFAYHNERHCLLGLQSLVFTSKYIQSVSHIYM